MLLAGFGQADITPRQHGLMSGYYLRTKSSTGVHDPLSVRVLMLKSGSTACAFCVLDLIGIPDHLLTGIRAQVGRVLSLPPAAIQVCATHTHAGPDSILPTSPAFDPGYVEFLCAASAQAARHAFESLHPATASYAHTSADGVGCRRGMPREKSAFSMPCDTVIFASPSHRSIMMTVFACHPTVLNEDNLLISRDLVYGCDKRLRELVPDTDFLFFNGSCGDISTRYTRRESSFREAERLGALWAEAVFQSLSHAEEITDVLWYQKNTLFVPPASYFSESERLEIIHYLESKIAACTDSQEKREYQASHSALVMPGYGTGEGCHAELTVVGLGDLALCMMPFEAASSDTQALGKEILARYGLRSVFFGYSNGNECYLPSGRPLDRDSGYEDMMASVRHDAKYRVMDTFLGMISDRYQAD